MPDPKKPRAPKNSKPLTVGLSLDLCEKARASVIARGNKARERMRSETLELEARHDDELKEIEASLGALLEKIIARVPEDQRDRARELCGVPEPQPDENARPRASIITNVGDMLEAAERDEKEQPIPPALLTEPEPVPYTERDREAGTTKRKTMGGGR